MAIHCKSTVSLSRRRLIELIQRINFGRIEGLVVRDGEPVLDNPAPRIFLEVKFGGENGPRSEAVADDFAVKAQVAELLNNFDRLKNTRIDVLTIKHGLPFGMHVEAAA